MATTAITGKQCTFEYGTISGTAQITTASIDETATSETIQTLGGSVAISQGVESEITADFLYDGEQGVPTSFYAALKAALDSGSTGVFTIDGAGSSWTGDAIVTALSAELPADGAVTCSATLTVSGAVVFTPGTPV